jgi:hypothetical protein
MYFITMVEDLIDKKKEIVEDHFNKMIEANTNMLKLIDNAMRNSKIKAGGKVSFLNKLKGELAIDKSRILQIKPDDMPEYSKNWFRLVEDTFNMMKQSSDEEYASLNKEIDEQIEIAKKEIEDMQKELKNTENNEKRTWLQREIDNTLTREWDDK